MHDLLTEPLIGVRTPPGERRLNLPELLAALSAGEIDGYTGLRPHQADPWHVFLVQLAASIQARRPTTALPTDPAYWHDGLLDLADGMETAWQLVVEDVTKPAFLQHPWKSWEAEAANFGVTVKRGLITFEPKASSPDELDVLITAKNHDLKKTRIQPSIPEAWLYALVLLQTTSGFLGQGNYGIARMNGGFASRPVVSWTCSLHSSIRFRDEVDTLQKLRSQVCADFHYQHRGVILTWLACWNRNAHQYPLTSLEPWFIEAPRPIRLLPTPEGSLLALGATSKASQIGPAMAYRGNVGDPWTPIRVKGDERTALTLSAEGFSPQRLTDLLFGQGYELTPLQQPQPGSGSGWFVASCLARGKGTTEGFHRTELLVPSKVRMMLLTQEHRDALAQLAQNLLSDAKDVQRALSTAMTVLTEGGPDKADFDRDAVKRWVERGRADFGRRWEALYFPTLWRGADEQHGAIRTAWQQRLVDKAQALLDEAIMSLPIPSNRSWKAVTQAQSALRGMLRKQGLPLPGHASAELDQEVTTS